MFLQLHNKTALQHSPEQLKETGTCNKTFQKTSRKGYTMQLFYRPLNELKLRCEKKNSMAMKKIGSYTNTVVEKFNTTSTCFLISSFYCRPLWLFFLMRTGAPLKNCIYKFFLNNNFSNQRTMKLHPTFLQPGGGWIMTECFFWVNCSFKDS